MARTGDAIKKLLEDIARKGAGHPEWRLAQGYTYNPGSTQFGASSFAPNPSLVGGAGKLVSGASGILNQFLSGISGTNSGSTNSGSTNSVGFGLSDFGKSVAPSVMSGAKHPSPGSGAGKGITQEQINAAARNAITAQYSPVISGLSKGIRRTKNQSQKARQQVRQRGNRAVGDLASMYGGLARDVSRTRRRGVQEYRQGIHESRGNYRGLARNVNATYNDSNSQTAKELQRLGIDPSVALSGSAKDQAFLGGLIKSDKRNTLEGQRASKRDFNSQLRRMRLDTIATGNAQVGASRDATNTALSDLAKQAADQIFQLRTQRASIKGQEAGAIAAQHAQTLAATAAAQAKAHDPNAKLDRQMKKAQLAKLLTQIPGTPGYVPTSSTSGTTGLTPLQKGMKQLNDLGQNDPKLASMLHVLSILPQGHTYAANTGYNTYQWDPKQYREIWQAVQREGVRHRYTPQEMNWIQAALQTALGI